MLRLIPTRSLSNPSQLQLKRFYSAVPRNDGRLPLKGIKVVDITRVLAGPYSTQILGDLGADVIKIEHPTRGDDTRAWGPPYAKSKTGGPGESAYFLGVNRNKKSVAVNFQHPRGQSIIRSLASSADILVENYLPGTLSKYGLGYEQLSILNPKLIYTSITGYGQTGPYKDRAGYDVMVEAEFGLMHITGTRDGPPVKVGVAVTDLTTGLYAVTSTLAALIARNKTGLGQHIDMALADCQVATLANIASSALISGENDSGRWGTAHPSIVPYEAFPTSDGSILLGGGNDKLYAVMCQRLGRPELITDERFVTNALRVKHRDVLVPSIGTITKTKTTQEWLEIFEGSGMPYAAINDVKTTLEHEHVKSRNMVTELEHSTCGTIKVVNTPMKFSHSKPEIRKPPPTLGEDTRSVLMGELGLTEEEIEELVGEGVVR